VIAPCCTSEWRRLDCFAQARNMRALAFEESQIVSWTVVRAAMPAVAAAVALVAAPVAHAQGRLDARYSVTLSGIPIGKGAWVIDIADKQYTAAASGTTAGLLRIFASGQGTSASRGFMVAGTPVPASFAASITTNKKTEVIRMTLGSGDVKDFAITPPPKPNPEMVPVTEAHRRGVSDPMTASLVRVLGNGNPVAPQACRRSVPVFDGRIRYNLKFAYKRMEQVKADKGYQGPAVVCAMYFVPVAGYVPSRTAIKYLAKQREMEAWLAPVAGTRVLVPFRVSIPTPLGLGVMEATQFVSLAQPRAAARARTQ
jgi:Protein of unknown function (DUF3108)